MFVIFDKYPAQNLGCSTKTKKRGEPGCKSAKTGAERNGQRGQRPRRTFCEVGRLRAFAPSSVRSVTAEKRGEPGCKSAKTGAERNGQRGQHPRRTFCEVGRLRAFAPSSVRSVTTPKRGKAKRQKKPPPRCANAGGRLFKLTCYERKFLLPVIFSSKTAALQGTPVSEPSPPGFYGACVWLT